MMRALVVLLAVLLPTAVIAESTRITMYVNPQCGCCEGHAQYLRENGFEVTVTPTNTMSLIRKQHGDVSRLVGAECDEALVIENDGLRARSARSARATMASRSLDAIRMFLFPFGYRG